MSRAIAQPRSNATLPANGGVPAMSEAFGPSVRRDDSRHGVPRRAGPARDRAVRP